jgi:hypothetical protein
MVVAVGRTVTAAVSRQIGDDDAEVCRQNGRNRVPHQARLRKTVEEQDRRPGSSAPNEDGTIFGRDLGLVGASYALLVHDQAAA